MTAGWVPEPRPDLGRLRAGHADRERAIDVLKAAFAEGRLDQDEYTERVGQAHAARTYGELAALTSDLPVGPLGSLVPASPPAPAPSLLPMTSLPQHQQHPAVDARKGESGVNGIALVSLLCAILALGLSWASLMAVPAMLGGLIALTAPGRRGRWMAFAAIALGVVALKRVM
jgi:Domain of unknown function (DUF1707)